MKRLKGRPATAPALDRALTLVVTALAIIGGASPAAAQLRPLEPAPWEMLQPGRRAEATLGAAVLYGQRASLAGTEGRLLEAGNFAIRLRFDRIVLEGAGTLYRRLDDEVVITPPMAETHPSDGDGRSDTGDYRVSTIVRLNSLESRTIALLRFGTRLPTTNNRVGLERDQTDFFALLGLGHTFNGLRLGAEAGVGINGTRDPTYEQSDVAVYALSAEYGAGVLRPTASFIGHFDGLKNGSARGSEDLKELRLGLQAHGGPWRVQLQGIKGFETFSPDYGAALTVGWIR